MGYSHTQKGHWHWVFILTTLSAAVPGVLLVGENLYLSIILMVSAAIIAFFGVGFGHLTVEEENDRLRVRFGPVPIFQKAIPYSDIVSAEPAQSSFIDGWGLHYTPGKGMIWNIWGWDCVSLTLQNGKTFRIGTDDVEGLIAHLNERIGR